jgi:hypothetical protein
MSGLINWLYTGGAGSKKKSLEEPNALSPVIGDHSFVIIIDRCHLQSIRSRGARPCLVYNTIYIYIMSLVLVLVVDWTVGTTCRHVRELGELWRPHTERRWRHIYTTVSYCTV